MNYKTYTSAFSTAKCLSSLSRAFLKDFFLATTLQTNIIVSCGSALGTHCSPLFKHLQFFQQVLLKVENKLMDKQDC